MARDDRLKMIRNLCYVLGGFCIVGIIACYAIGRANRTRAGLDVAITCMIVLPWLFILLDVLVLVLLGKEIRRRFRQNQLKLAVAIFLFLGLALAISIFLFGTCGVAVYSIG
jgi:hypothetical protein